MDYHKKCKKLLDMVRYNFKRLRNKYDLKYDLVTNIFKAFISKKSWNEGQLNLKYLKLGTVKPQESQ